MSAVGVWESRGPGAGMGGSDRPRDFQRTGGARLADLQIQRDVDRASPGRALPQRPVGVRCTVRSCGDASATSTHASNRALPPATAWQCQHAQFAGAQRDPVRRRAGVQVARVAEALWELAHDLHPYESLVQERGARPGLRTPATRPVDPHQAGGGVAGQHRRQGPSRRHGGSKKTAPKPSASPAAGGPPRFIWLPRMLARH